MQFSRESLTTSFLDEISPLIRDHYKEIAHYQDIPLAPNYQRYVDLEQAGSLRVFTMRDDSHRLVGYAVFIVNYNMHYQGSLQAMQDILYLDPVLRGARHGEALISFCDEKLKAEAVQVVYHHVKEKHNFGPLLVKLGYELIDVIYGRRLDG